MLNFELYNPVKIVFGPGESKRVGTYAKDFGKKAMLVSYEEHSFFTDLLNAVKKNLEDNGVQVTEFYKVQANPLLSHIRQAIDICRKEKVDMVIAVGGGSVMDCCKAVSLQVCDGKAAVLTLQDEKLILCHKPQIERHVFQCQNFFFFHT